MCFFLTADDFLSLSEQETAPTPWKQERSRPEVAFPGSSSSRRALGSWRSEVRGQDVNALSEPEAEERHTWRRLIGSARERVQGRQQTAQV
ncbi:hypothetical protein chiPu_0005065 [Chiloscyllium punctatum]|uniref:Uncharacterized protein n=1 Tax=Chiloscyllium punctatum TaxID=137246 RepID=A0A401S8C4_CHIPU|nr:hypothetical protein [Chiloscyllium punctatum]